LLRSLLSGSDERTDCGYIASIVAIRGNVPRVLCNYPESRS
jgi:hypothetical protein